MLLCRLDSAALLQGNVSVHTQLPSSSPGVHPECINLAKLCSFQEKVFSTLKVHLPFPFETQIHSMLPRQPDTKPTPICSASGEVEVHSLLQPLLPRAPARSCCPGPPRAALPGGGRKKREGGGGRKQKKEKGRRMEGTWEDERWSEKGEGVSVTELISDSLHILTALPDMQGAPCATSLHLTHRFCTVQLGTYTAPQQTTSHVSL